MNWYRYFFAFLKNLIFYGKTDELVERDSAEKVSTSKEYEERTMKEKVEKMQGSFNQSFEVKTIFQKPIESANE
jgi:hypothetical protein